MQPIITINPKIMHGAPCFAGTRVAVQTFFDHLEAGYTIDGFLEEFPTVARQQVARLLEVLREDAARVAGRRRVIEDVRQARAQLTDGTAKPASVDQIMREIES